MTRARIFTVFPLALLLHCSADENAAGPRTSKDAGTNTEAGSDAGPEAGQDATVDSPPAQDAPPGVDAGRCSVTGDGRTTVMFVNRCSEPITFQGSDVADGTLAPGESDCRDIGSDVEPLSSKRYWGFAAPDPGAGRRSLAEFTFNTDFNDFDWFNLSHVDAFNLPLRIHPVDRPDCRTLTCAEDLLAACPSEGRYPEQGETTACVSPDRDDPTNPVASYFETSCEDAYSWSGDDADSMVACAGEDYDIEFCPAP